MSRLSISDVVRTMLECADAIWLYQGPPSKERPHALLHAGQHSDGYANVGDFLKGNPAARLALAHYLLELYQKAGGGFFTRVVGADTSSTALAEDVAKVAGVNHIVMKKVEGEKRQVWVPENLPLTETDVILQIEELITTSSSALQVREGIFSAQGHIPIRYAPFLPVIVNRSDPDNRITYVNSSAVLLLLQLDIRTYDPGPESCPYCKAGSRAIKPKEGDNWFLLTGKPKASR